MNCARFLGVLCVTGILSAMLACGKKGPPFLPQREFSLSVIDLRGEWVKGEIRLKGNISSLQGSKGGRDQIKGARVYYAQYPLESPPCASCPIEYEGYHGFGAEVVVEEGFFCRVPIRVRGQVYFFRVNLMGPGGATGPPSDTIKVVVE